MAAPLELCAIDAGQTDIRFAVCTGDRELLSGRTGKGITNILLEGAVASLEANLREVRRQVRSALGTGRFRVVAAGATGVSRERREYPVMREVFAAAFPGARLVLDSDVITSHAANFKGRPGIILHAGTGDFAYGVDRDGGTLRVGGWGYLLGDEGSGFGLGLSGIRAALRAMEGAGPDTSLKEELLGFFGIADLVELKPVVYSAAFQRRQIAEFAPRVVRHARGGDAVAGRLFEEAAGRMAGLVAPILDRLRFQRADLALTGALFLRNPSFYEATRGLLVSRHGPRLRVRRGLGSSLEGAVWLGRRALGTGA